MGMTCLGTPATVVHVLEGLQLLGFQEGLDELQASSLALMPRVCHVPLGPNHSTGGCYQLLTKGVNGGVGHLPS